MPAGNEGECSLQLGQAQRLMPASGVTHQRVKPCHGATGGAGRVRTDPPMPPRQGEPLPDRLSQALKPLTDEGGFHRHDHLLPSRGRQSVFQDFRGLGPPSVRFDP